MAPVRAPRLYALLGATALLGALGSTRARAERPPASRAASSKPATSRPAGRPASRPSGAKDRAAPATDDFDFGEDDVEPATDDFDFGEDDGKPATDDFDFGDTGDGAAGGAGPPSPPPLPWWRRGLTLGGFVRSEWALWAERFSSNPFAKGRQNLDLALRWRYRWIRLHLAGHVEYDFAYLADDYDDATRDAYQWLVTSRELLVAFSFGQFEITLGRQIVGWGQGQTLAALDVVNPGDMREPGLAEIDDIRQPVLATRVGWFRGPHRLELMVVHEANYGFRSPPRGPFSPLQKLLDANPLVAGLIGDREIRYGHTPGRFSKAQQVYGRWLYRGPGIDTGLYAASVLDKQGVLAIDPRQLLAAEELVIRLAHRRYTVLGHAGTIPAGPWLFRWELGAELGRSVNVGRVAALRIVKADLVDVLVGVTYGGIEDLSLSVEVWQPWFINKPRELLVDLSVVRIALRAAYSLLRERLRLQVVALIFGVALEQGWLLRGDASYEIIDSLHATVGYVTYQPGDQFGAIFGLDRHDRIYLRVRWDFALL